MKSNTYQRVNISLPSKTLQRIDNITEHGDRSRLIDVAVKFYLSQRSREQLRSALREGAIERFSRDREIAVELFGLNDTWENREKR